MTTTTSTGDNEWSQFTESDTTTTTTTTSSTVDMNPNTNNFELDKHEPPPPLPLSLSDLQQLRQQANQFFAQREYDTALAVYSSAIDSLQQQLHTQQTMSTSPSPMLMQSDYEFLELTLILFCNRSACLFKMDCFQEAKEDALQAISISNSRKCTTWVQYTLKAYFRLARAMLALQEIHAAILHVETALGLLTEVEGEMEGVVGVDWTSMKDELQALLDTAKKQQQSNTITTTTTTTTTTTPSIRDFSLLQELGQGNFSRVVVVSYKSSHNNSQQQQGQQQQQQQQYALKMMEKKQVEQLAKRQHPNVYQEIAMEKRVLLKRLNHPQQPPDTPTIDAYKREFIIHMISTFQDYNHFYFLMDLHSECGDLWSTMRCPAFIPPHERSTIKTTSTKRVMVGTLSSLVKIYLYEILCALEFIHSRGIIHRDLKSENVLLSSKGHVVLIDFGTAKDLVETDLNGPEFVGTPDFMSPETLENESTGGTKHKSPLYLESSSDTRLDLWALGVMAYQLLTGTTPFWSPSPFLTFLKIQRGQFYRSMGIVDDDAWDLIQQLIVVDPNQRLGASCFQVDSDATSGKRMTSCNALREYTPIREHSYFASLQKQHPEFVSSSFPQQRPIPSLRDLCIRACCTLIQQDSYNIHLDTSYSPGDGSKHDILRLNTQDKKRIMHILDKMRVLSEPRIYRRFFLSKQEARWNKVRSATCDYIGLTQMNDKQGQFPMSSQDEAQGATSAEVLVDVTARIQPMRILHLSNPLFAIEEESCDQDHAHPSSSLYMEQLKQSVKRINQIRPKVVVVSGFIHESCKKVLSKVNESIPVILNNGVHYFSFWLCGAQGLVLCTKDFLLLSSEHPKQTPQYQWLAQELEQSQMAQHPAFAFVDCTVDQIPPWLLLTLAKGKVLCLFGIANPEDGEVGKEYVYNSKDDGLIKEEQHLVDDDNSSSCTDESTTHCMRIIGRGDSSLRCILLEDGGEWTLENID